jgi:uncharacterized Zn finger protein
VIPRKEAQRLLEEFFKRLASAEEEAGEELDGEGIAALARDLLAESDLVLRGKENVEQKARRYLTEGRVSVERVGDGTGFVVARARGSAAETYALGYDPRRKEWRCTCGPAGRRGACSHATALKLIVTLETTGGTT